MSSTGHARHHRDRTQLFADISRMTTMPFPNLLYRRLAEHPGQLEACWNRVRPGLHFVGAPALRKRLVGAGPTPAGNDRTLPDEGGRRLLFDVLDVYDAGNSCNAVLVHLLLNGAKGTPESSLIRAPQPGPPQNPPAIPPMLELEAMPGSVRERVVRLARLVEPGSTIVPSVFRHLAADDSLLPAVETTLRAASTAGVLDTTYDQMRATLAKTADEWPLPVNPVQDSATRTVIEPFAATIPRMLAASAILRTALGPDTAEATNRRIPGPPAGPLPRGPHDQTRRPARVHRTGPGAGVRGVHQHSRGVLGRLPARQRRRGRHP